MLERDVVYTYDLAPVDVDNLLIEQVAPDPQHVLVIVIRRQYFIDQPYSALEGD